MDNPIAKKPNYFSLWITLLLLANHDEERSFIWNGKRIKQEKGQFVTGRKKLKEISGIPETTIERILTYLENEHQIGQQKTSKYRLIKIVKWEEYQSMDIRTDNKRTTNGQQTDTIKNLRIKEDKNNTGEAGASQEVAILIKSFSVINPACSGYYGNTTQRKACDNLIKTYSFEKVKRVIENTLPKTNLLEYYPKITTPLQLWEKWSVLENQVKSKFIKKSDSNNNIAFV